MMYRIRYRDGQTYPQAEMVVEANTPMEALVKFRHVRSPVEGRAWRGEQVTSVSSEASCCDGWGAVE